MNAGAISLFQLLEQKNSYLMEFHKINMDELQRLAEGSMDNLENFYYSRELLLNAINKLDNKISHNKMESLRVNKREKKKLIDVLNLKKKMILSILDQDLAIISLVDQLKKANTKDIAV
ncbi:MAG: hypothetical protein OXN83_06275 [Oligoflexia bacterium]|nr:hypothetical protein [Oligoflexia bacterium]